MDYGTPGTGQGRKSSRAVAPGHHRRKVTTCGLGRITGANLVQGRPSVAPLFSNIFGGDRLYAARISRMTAPMSGTRSTNGVPNPVRDASRYGRRLAYLSGSHSPYQSRNDSRPRAALDGVRQLRQSAQRVATTAPMCRVRLTTSGRVQMVLTCTRRRQRDNTKRVLTSDRVETGVGTDRFCLL